MAHRRAHKWAFPLGLLLVALAIVGAVSLANMAIRGVREYLDNPAEREEFENYLAQIIVHDPNPFDSPAQVQENVAQLLDICIWSLLREKNNTPGDYPMDDEGNMEIQLDEVAAKYRALFGIEPPGYVSVEGTDFDFIYDSVAKVYRVPISGVLEIYVPQIPVDGIKRIGSSVELTVNYLAYSDANLDEKNRRAELVPAKTMIITLLEQDDEAHPWQVSAIRQPVGADLFMAGAPVIP